MQGVPRLRGWTEADSGEILLCEQARDKKEKEDTERDRENGDKERGRDYAVERLCLFNRFKKITNNSEGGEGTWIMEERGCLLVSRGGT